MKKFIVIALIATTLLGLTACSSSVFIPGSDSPEGSHTPRFESIEQMAKGTRHIVRVEVLALNVRQEYVPLGSRLQRLYIHQLRVLEVIQGVTQPGDIIEVGAPTEDGFRRFSGREGDDLVLFLMRGEESPVIRLQHPFQAEYRFPHSYESILDLDADIVLPSMRQENNLTLTIGELQQIMERNFGEDLTQ